MTVYNEKVITELKEELEQAKKKIVYLEKIVSNFKKYYDSWPRFVTQLGIKDE